MRVTVITLRRGVMEESFVGVINGTIPNERKKEIARSFHLQGTDGGEIDEMSFCECDVEDEVIEVNNIHSDGYINSLGEMEFSD